MKHDIEINLSNAHVELKILLWPLSYVERQGNNNRRRCNEYILISQNNNNNREVSHQNKNKFTK